MIRLIDTSDLSQHEFEGEYVPAYAILSHLWKFGEEISLKELQDNLNQDKQGWEKLRDFCHYAQQNGHRFVWMDTCCIDKTSSAELSEAINSMFRWYRRAERCYAYLHDVPAREDFGEDECLWRFKHSEWFTRGWTLQELLAPKDLWFVCSSWKEMIGTRMSLRHDVSQVTKIPEEALVDGWSFWSSQGNQQYAVARVMSWASNRRTTRVEDMAYSLMGLFHINMPLLYGEGRNAFVRLQSEIMSKYDDNSLFAWSAPLEFESYRDIGRPWVTNRALDIPEGYLWGSLLCPTVQCFRECASHYAYQRQNAPNFSMTSKWIKVEGLVQRDDIVGRDIDRWILPLTCGRKDPHADNLGILLEEQHSPDLPDELTCARLNLQVVICREEAHPGAGYERRTIFIRQRWPSDFE